MNQEITIRRAETPADYRACQEAQRLAWGIAEDGYLVPVATMVGAQLHGGLVARRLPPRRPGGRPLIRLPGEGRGAGRPLLAAHGGRPGPSGSRDRRHAQACPTRDRPIRGGPRSSPGRSTRFSRATPGSTWTSSAQLSGRYVEDMYGPRTDALNQGTPTDRLIVVWEVEPSSKAEAIPEDPSRIPRLIEAETRPDGFRAVKEVREHPGATWLSLEVPTGDRSDSCR